MKINFQKIPSIVWVFLFIALIVGVIAAMIGSVVLIGTVPGVASVIFLLIGVAYFLGPKETYTSGGEHAIVRGIGITFFALMGMAIDQTGNYIYNYPLRYLCPPETEIVRSTRVSHPLPGRTDFTQDFQCEDTDGDSVKEIAIGYLIGLRFIEYVGLAYLFIFLKSQKNWFTKGK